MLNSRERWSRNRLFKDMSLFQKIAAYQLEAHLLAGALLTALTVVFVVLYYYEKDGAGFAANLYLALATSLLASVLVLVSDIWVQFRNQRNKLFLEGIEKLGISNLHFEKRSILSDLMKKSSKQICFVGYRLILSAALAEEMTGAVARGASVKIVLTPPWRDVFKLVYDEKKDWVSLNYKKVFDSIIRGHDSENLMFKERPLTSDEIQRLVEALGSAEVRFINRPFFSDTYIVDGSAVTGPYVNNEKPGEGMLSANDFFTYELHDKTELFQMVNDEFTSLWRRADQRLDWSKYLAKLPELSADMSDTKRLALLQECVEPMRPEAEADAETVMADKARITHIVDDAAKARNDQK